MRSIFDLVAATLVICLGAPLASAQTTLITTDGSLGARVDLSGDLTIIGGELGRRSGENLFHSFDRFSVLTRTDGLSETIGTVVFGVPDGVGTIINRVTGPEASSLNGLISFADDATKSLPVAADLWFFNPNGVVIGPNAQFRTSGALYFSGGDSVIFSDGATFSADATRPLTITSARPEAFGFLTREPGPVVIRDVPLPAQGDGITLAGGEVVIDGAILLADQPGEALTLIAGGQGDVAPVQPGERLVLTSGRIRIEGELAGDVRTGALETRDGGAIRLFAGDIEIDGGRVLTISSRADGGDIDVQADRLELANGAEIGTLAIGVADGLDPDDEAFDAGAVGVAARDITLIRGGRIRSQTIGDGDAGAVSVSGFDTLLISRDGGDVETAIESEVSVGAAGDAGLVLVTGGELDLIDGGSILSVTFGDGDAGGVEVDVARLIATDGAQIGSGARDNPMAQAPATGAGGAVTVRASESMSFSGLRRPLPTDPPDVELGSSGIFTATEGRDTGDSGALFASAPLILMTDEAEIGAETFSDALAGDITLEGGMLVVSGGSEISTTSRTTGRAGNVTLRFSESVDLPFDGSVASNALQAGGTAGRVLIRTGRLDVGAGSRIATESEATNGGDIFVNVTGLALIKGDGRVTTSVASDEGDGGLISFRGGPLALADAALLESTADAGTGGDVRISSAITFVEQPNALIDVSSNAGQDGVIQFLGAVGDQTAETEAPPAEFFNRFALIDDFCVAAVTGGSALRLVAPEAPPLSAAMAPALFGGAIPYPAAAGRAEALTLTLAAAGGGCDEAVQ